jgi:hypothetical protein
MAARTHRGAPFVIPCADRGLPAPGYFGRASQAFQVASSWPADTSSP